MKILVIGSGGREHALVWKLAQSKKVEKIWAAPGNGGTSGEDKTENFLMDIDPGDIEGQKILLDFAQKEKIDLTVVGPETPLAAGIVDKFRAAGLAIVGPDSKAARLESSKVFSNTFMNHYGVRAPKRKNFSDPAAAIEYAQGHFGKKRRADETPVPLVIKADGLASGKGVVIAGTLDEAKECLSSFMKKSSLGSAGKNILFEEFIEGREVSVMAAVSVSPGKKPVIKPFISARDHKSRFEGGKGPNTGGMGAIAPVPDFTARIQKDFANAIVAPTLKGMIAENMDYRGFIFFGLMVKDDQCYLLEYNVRLGDPETQALLPLLDSDFYELCLSILDGSLSSFNLKWKKEFSCAPVVVVSGYPGSYPKGLPVAMNTTRLEKLGAKVFVAGAQRGGGGHLGSGLRTSGGRVLAVSCLGADQSEAHRRAYEALGFINFEGMDYRKDIGKASSADNGKADGSDGGNG
ncbi:MAG: phosphoribosylamine--glycine ligase [Treponema sp.]|nr:phosphoribosylamine--glycine ligase [Treponema sp.]